MIPSPINECNTQTNSPPPRTRHLNPDGSAKYTNRLAQETSPYLLQHAHNPVDWYAWGEEAFTSARKLNHPVLVSIGYSTCHWCHVMEEESFEDEEIAGFMNDHFICIKVDREERPDIDAIYMGAVQLLTGQGGWPLNVILTQDMKPFFGGTYFPARDGDRGAFTGFYSLLKKIAEAWDEKQSIIAQTGEEISKHLRKMLTPDPGSTLPLKDVIDHAAHFFKSVYDPVYGGMKGAPKFPASFHTRFLFQASAISGDKELERMALHTLDAMANGGMYDHVGGGFHRYATDEKWLVPHFEKMLYDNALLVTAYLDAFKITKNERYEAVVREILDYVIRDMTAIEGGFYSATDADSLTPEGEKEEGYHFTWTREELSRALSPNLLSLALSYFSMGGAPSFEGRHIPHITGKGLCEAEKLGYFPEDIRLIKQTLYQAREIRKRPSTDTKILASWNGLMISAFARAGHALQDQAYIETAKKAARFILNNLTRKGRLLRTYTSGTARYNAYLDDYAFVTASFLDLYEATGDTEWLDHATRLDQALETYYEDKEHGGFFMTSSDHETLIAREKPYHDGALPSGNSIAVMNLLRLHDFSKDSGLIPRAEKAFSAFSQAISKSPGACGELLVAFSRYIHTPG